MLFTSVLGLCQHNTGGVGGVLSTSVLAGRVNTPNPPLHHTALHQTSYSFGYQTGRRTGLVLWGKLSLSGKGLGQGFLNVAEMMVLVVFLDSIVF